LRWRRKIDGSGNYSRNMIEGWERVCIRKLDMVEPKDVKLERARRTMTRLGVASGLTEGNGGFQATI
jgi:hypothetical protein